MLDRFGVLEQVPDIAAVQGMLIRMLVVEIRRDADEAVARQTLSKVASMLHEAVALMHENYGRDLAAAGRHSEKRRQPPGATNGLGHDLRHGGRAIPGTARERSSSLGSHQDMRDPQQYSDP
jgi:hypothetical protein